MYKRIYVFKVGRKKTLHSVFFSIVTYLSETVSQTIKNVKNVSP